ATETTATNTVRRRAWVTSGSLKRSVRVENPSWNVFLATRATGQATSITRYTITTMRNTHRVTPRLSRSFRMARSAARARSADRGPEPLVDGRSMTIASATAHHPPLDEVEHDDHDQRDDEQDGRHRGGAVEVVVLDAA